jgi:peroxiredoxin
MALPVPAGRPPDFGEPAPFFTAETDGVANYSIEVAAGRWILLMVFGSLGVEACRLGHDAVLDRRNLFNDTDAAFFGVSVDIKDRLERGLANAPPGVRYFWDFDLKICRLYNLIEGGSLRPAVFLIDRSFRILAAEPMENVAAVLDQLQAALQGEPEAVESLAPILILPRVFEPDFCKTLIDYFEARQPQPSGFAAEVAGRTVTVLNPLLKRRHDVTLEDGDLIAAVEAKFAARLTPMLKRAYGWRPSQIERFLITAYQSSDRGFFSAHRDDVTAGTAHRKFAVTVNLNAEGYVGGDLRFPEFGRRLYRPPTGGAAVFSCALLHEVAPVESGVRYAFVPFLYDEAGAKLRKANLALVGASPAGRRSRRAPSAVNRTDRR